MPAPECQGSPGAVTEGPQNPLGDAQTGQEASGKGYPMTPLVAFFLGAWLGLSLGIALVVALLARGAPEGR